MDTSYLSTQVTTIIGQLHGLFEEIGVPSHERESRETEVSNNAPIGRSSGNTTNVDIAFHSSIRNSTQSTSSRYSVRTSLPVACGLLAYRS